MGRPRAHDSDTAEALLGSAERVVAADGPGALSVRRVADDAGTTTRAIYSLFGSKNGLLVALGAHGFDLLGAEVARLAATKDPLDDLLAAGLVFRRFTLDRPVLFRVSFQREGVPSDLAVLFADSQQTALSQLVARLQRLADNGRLGRCSPLQAALYFHAACEGLAAMELRGVLPARSATRMWREALRALLVGLAESA
jgi:AcrR family transcriptional regulator